MATPAFNTATLTAKVFKSGAIATTSGTGEAAYSVPASRCAKIQTVSVTSTHGSSVTVDVYVVPNGATAGDEHKVVNGYVLATTDTVSLSQYFAGMMLGEQDVIKVKSSQANGINVVVTGVEGV